MHGVRILAPTRRNLAALGAVAALLAVGYVFVPHPVVRYTVWLLIFSVWMAWFIVTAREWIANADF